MKGEGGGESWEGGTEVTLSKDPLWPTTGRCFSRFSPYQVGVRYTGVYTSGMAGLAVGSKMKER